MKKEKVRSHLSIADRVEIAAGLAERRTATEIASIQDRLCKDDGLKGGEGTLLRGEERGLREKLQRLCKEG